MSKDLYFLIEGGQMLHLVRCHIQARIDQNERNAEFAKRFGAEEWSEYYLDGTVARVVLPEPRDDFIKPDSDGRSRPKKTSPHWKEWNEQIGTDRTGSTLAKTLGIPSVIEYKRESDGVEGLGSISRSMGAGCGFLYLGVEGPYCFYMPDIAERVRYYTDQGYTVDISYPTEFDGARPILKEEWELIVAQHAVDGVRK